MSTGQTIIANAKEVRVNLPCSLEEFLLQARKTLIMKALELSGGKQVAASKLLGITPQAVHTFLKNHQMN